MSIKTSRIYKSLNFTNLLLNQLLRRNTVCTILDISVLFNKMFKFLLTLGVGIYAGIYISQNYEVPRVDEPTKIIERIKEFAEEYKKK